MMKTLLLLLLIIVVIPDSSFSQSIYERTGHSPVIGVGYGRVLAGTGDMPGHQFLFNVQKRMTKRSGLDIRLVGTLIEQNTVFGPGFETYEKSNGASLEVDYNLFINLGRFSFYPSVGPAIRYSHERHNRHLSIASDGRGNIVDFSYEIDESEPLQIGYTFGLNFDAAITRTVILGLRGSVQNFNSGHQFAFMGITVKSIAWHF